MADRQPNVPWLLDCEPRAVQQEALRRSHFGVATQDRVNGEVFHEYLPHYDEGPAKGWAWFMEMRLGKTPTALNEFELFKREYGITRLLILSPNTYKLTWEMELDKFGCSVPGLAFESRHRQSHASWLNRHNECALIINYEATRQRPTLEILEDFVDDRTLIIADESVLIKNYRAISTKNLLALSKRAAAVRAMTGQPAPQGVHDLYSQLRFIRTLQDTNYYQFRNRYAVMGGFQMKQVKGLKNQKELAGMLRQVSFVAKRRYWAESVHPDYELVSLQLENEQLQYYKQMDDELLLYLDGEDETITAAQAGAKWAKLQQISTGFIYDEHGKPHWLVPFDRTPKFRAFIQRMEFISGKAIVVANHAPTVEMLFARLSDYNPAVIANGQQMRKLGLSVEQEKRRFNEDDNCRVMVVQERSAKYGHTLLGTERKPCNTTVFFENSFSYDDRVQVEQRNQAVGKLEPVHIMDFVSGTAERRVIANLKAKQEMAEKILEQEIEK